MTKPILNLDHYKHDCVFYTEKCASDSESYMGQGDYHCWCECEKHKMVQVPGTEHQTYYNAWCPMYCKSYNDTVCPRCLIKLTPQYIGIDGPRGYVFRLICKTVGCPNWDAEILHVEY